MSVTLVHLGPDEVDAALLLAGEASVRVRARGPDVPRLVAAGFVETPARIETFVRCPFPAERLAHRHRNMARARKAWHAAELSIALTRVGELGFSRFLESVYHPIFAPQYYARGITPYGAHEEAGMRALAPDDAPLALVFRANEVVGAAVLREGSAIAEDRTTALAGPLPDGPFHEGLLYGLLPRFAECRRALMVALADAYGAAGQRWLSLGQDHATCDVGYLDVFVQKLLLADTVIARYAEATHDLVSYVVTPGEAFVSFAGRCGDTLTLRGVGAAERERTRVLDALRPSA